MPSCSHSLISGSCLKHMKDNTTPGANGTQIEDAEVDGLEIDDLILPTGMSFLEFLSGSNNKGGQIRLQYVSR